MHVGADLAVTQPYQARFFPQPTLHIFMRHHENHAIYDPYSTAKMEETKPVHTIILDAGPLIKNDPSVSSLLKHAHRITTTPQVVSEIRDEATRARLDTILRPFLDVREPRPASVKFVSDFARRTGDFPVLSRTDILLLALTYEVECERNLGDWRLRRDPKQKGLNGVPPWKGADAPAPADPDAAADVKPESTTEQASDVAAITNVDDKEAAAVEQAAISTIADEQPQSDDVPSLEAQIAAATLSEQQPESAPQGATHNTSDKSQDPSEADSEEEEDDAGGWITPSNLKKKQAADASSSSNTRKNKTPGAPEKTMQAALLTSDFAMQNVALQVNLNLIGPSLSRIRRARSHVLRCHACFTVCRDLGKQFCPKCGGPTLTRVACSTDAAGSLQLHFSKNFTFNTRGDRYSIPKPVAGTSSGKIVPGGGKGGWGQTLILAEDQKEYERAITQQRRVKERDAMDDDYLPGIVSGERSRHAARPRVGAGRNVNAKKRR